MSGGRAQVLHLLPTTSSTSGANLEDTKGDKICGAGNLSDLGHKFSPDSSRSESGKQRFLSLPSPLSTKLFHLLTFIFNAAAAFGCIGVAKLSALFSSGPFRKKFEPR